MPFLVKHMMGYVRRASVVSSNWVGTVARPSRWYLPAAPGGSRAEGHWCQLRDMGVARRSHSRESGNLLGKPSEMRCRRNGFPLSRE
jgi:hypothetical protein